MKTRARFFLLILAVTLLTLVSACKQNKSLSAYYDENNNNFSGSGDNNNDCGGCCGCDDEEPITCDSVISIVDKQGLPVENATVTVYGSRTRIFFTDDNGEASVTGFSDGEYVIKVEAEGFNDKVTLITVVDNVCPNIEVLLVAEPVEPVLLCNANFSVSIHRNSGENYPHAGAVATIDLGGGSTVSCTTDATGLCSIPNIPDGDYPYTVATNVGKIIKSGTYHVADHVCPTITAIFQECPVFFYFHTVEPSVPVDGVELNIFGETLYSGGAYGDGFVYTGNVTGSYPYTIVPPAGYEPVAPGILTISESGACPTVDVPLITIPPETCEANFHVTQDTKDFGAIDFAGAQANINLGAGGIISCVTDALGLCSITGIPDGDYPYEIKVDGAVVGSGTYHVADHVCPTVNTVFQQCDISFYFYRRNVTSQIPVENVDLYINGTHYFSDVGGMVNVEDLYSGSYFYVATPPAPFDPISDDLIINSSGGCPVLQSIELGSGE